MNTLRLASTPPRMSINPEFDDFLYAQLGEETNGMQLSVLSALARRNVDPWDIARQLAALPRESAARLLASMLPNSATGDADAAPRERFAARLVALLPAPRTPALNAAFSRREQDSTQPAPTTGRIRLIVALALLMLLSQWLLSSLTSKEVAARPDPAAALAPSIVAKPGATLPE
jgi:hypothetical protein